MATRTMRLEQEAEEARAELADTLEALRERMTPGRVVDEVIEYARHGDGAAMVTNLRRQVVEKPLALGLVGMGLAWLMMPTKSAGNGRWSGANRGTEGSVGSTAANVAREGLSAGSKAASDAASRISNAGHSVREAMSEGYDRLTHSAGEAARSVKRSVFAAQHRFRDTAASAGDELGSVGQTFWSLCREQPLLTAGLGLALGAALGAAFPRTETEDRLFGETSDDLKDTTQDIAREQLDAVKQTAHRVVDDAQNAISESTDRLSGTGSELAEATESRPTDAGSSKKSETQGASGHGQH